MSSVFWQTMKQTELLSHGKGITERIEDYLMVWENRCYSEGIPDEVPEKIMKQLRAPSYKSIAMAILKNDHALKTLGFNVKPSEYYLQLSKKDSDQLPLF
jgi:predicted phosphoadenosine phosphosulfate sulfurtransferase